MSRLMLSNDEIGCIKTLIGELASRFDTAEDPAFLQDAPVYAHELPRRVREFLNVFRLCEPDEALCTISGFPVDDEGIGTTPVHWKLRDGRSPVLQEEMFLVLLGSLLGDCIGWSTQQDGHIVHDIMPIKGNEQEQLGSGSETLLWWHTEDAFHPYRGDYLGMMCLRNPDAVATTFATITGFDQVLTPRQIQLLMEEHFTIRPDESHLVKNKSEMRQTDDALAAAYERIETMNTTPQKIAVLYGDPRSPYVRLDPYFMDPVAGNPEAQEALDILVAFVDRKLGDHVLNQGDVCFIDNVKGVHGRKPFVARYDGKDRWLKRINIARDLRKSRPSRPAADSRVIL
ncbi:MAG: guanitoxin biosynthesis L-enduracididine beta-hydroxylase GntD [Acidobacteriota bacterium]